MMETIVPPDGFQPITAGTEVDADCYRLQDRNGLTRTLGGMAVTSATAQWALPAPCRGSLRRFPLPLAC